jgi:uncharacterized protein YjiS (DUF1127 family)
MSATVSTIVRSRIQPKARPEAENRPGAFFSACWYAIARHFARRAAIRSLGELNDRALRDIGIERSQIEAAVHGFVELPDRMRM